jgi:hypothetical protein
MRKCNVLLGSMLLAVGCLTTACGDSPKPVQPAPTKSASAPTSDSISGRAILEGALAQASEGFLMVSAFPPGSRMPLLSYRVPISDPSIQKGSDGRRVFTFHLDPHTSMIPGSVPAGTQVELEIRYDRDGVVETKDGDVTAKSTVKVGDSALELVLSGG